MAEVEIAPPPLVARMYQIELLERAKVSRISVFDPDDRL
jgi:hypothetical protein